MELFGLLFKTDKHQKLTELLLVEGLTASMHELATMSGLPYATTYDVLHKMEKTGLVKKSKNGRATLFSVNEAAEQLLLVLRVLNKTRRKKKPLADYEAMDLPLLGEFPELYEEKAQSLEELLVKAVYLSKKNATLLRVLPLLVNKLGSELDLDHLVFWSKRFHVDRELGFVLDLTALLSGNKKLAKNAKKFKDDRWNRSDSFFEREKNLSGFQAKLVEENTPELAKKWFLKLNMGLDSFRSHFLKFA